MTRTITDPSELDALPPWAVVEDAHRIAWVNHPAALGRPDHWVSFYGDRMSARSVSSYAPVTVLHDPSVPALVVSDAAVEAAAPALYERMRMTTPGGDRYPEWDVESRQAEPWLGDARAALAAALPLLTAAPSATREDVARTIDEGAFDFPEECAGDIEMALQTAHALLVRFTITPRTDR